MIAITFLPAPQTLPGILNQVCTNAVLAAAPAKAPFCHLCSSSSHVLEQLNEPFTQYLNKGLIWLFLDVLFFIITTDNNLRSDIAVTKPEYVQLIGLMTVLLHHPESAQLVLLQYI